MKTLYQKLERLGLMPDELTGQVAVVTGAGQGLGRELALALGALGAHVVIAELKQSGDETCKLIRKYGGSAIAIKTDVGDKQSMLQFKEAVSEKFGKIDILVNNASQSYFGSFLEQPLEVWDRTYEVNLKAPVMAIKMFLPGMMRRKKGIIVNVTTNEGEPYESSFSASKAALRSLTVSLSKELKHYNNLYAYTFLPGVMDTPEAEKRMSKVAPKLGLGENEIKNAVFNPGYKGLMPAEDCAAGFAYTIVNAEKYNGEVTSPFHALLQADMIGLSYSHSEPTGITGNNHNSGSDKQFFRLRSLKLTQKLHDMLVELKKEMSREDIISRLKRKRRFELEAGMSIEQWIKTSVNLQKKLQQNSVSNPHNGYSKNETPPPHNNWKEKLPGIRLVLDDLASYFEHDEPSETTEEIDSNVLVSRKLKKVNQTRRQVIISLKNALEQEMV